ncbi:cell division protein [Bacillus cereus]|uniref:ATP-binding protein n=1 Tax=Bacillus sp. AFS023182 TaxID=2033492 RepID=UPI000BF56BF5|nr:ATP-binding protein [Bacillus sp. AFS023182]PFE04590.1 cell division protein [Bacillus sp. AFS023182]PGY00384.1 cell division protein [Bacillus cereus]
MNKIDVLKQVLAQDEENGSIWYLIGVEYKEQGDIANALQALSKALQYGNQEWKNKVAAELEALSQVLTSPKETIYVTEEESQCENNEDHVIEQDPEKEKQLHAVYANENMEENVVSMNVLQGGRSKQNREQEQITFEDVGGLHDVKKAIQMKIIKPFTSPGLFERFKKKVGGGILLYGPPGCGKTYIAKATAGECRAHFATMSITDILDPYIGVSEQNVREIFRYARSQKPCILFLDEMDALGFNRSKASGNPTLRTVIDQLLTEIEGIDTNTDKLLLIGATNMPWDIDPAFKRPGRFDKMIFVSPPDLEARSSIFQIKLAGKPISTIDYDMLAKETELYSGADIENVVELAVENVLGEIMTTGVERAVTMKDITDAIAETKPSTLEWFRTIKNYIKYANESGAYDDVQAYLKRYKKI